MTGRVNTRIAALGATMALLFAGPAAAQTGSPTGDAYGGQQNEVLGNFGGGGQDDVIPPAGEPAPRESGQPLPASPGTPVTPVTRANPVERGADAPSAPSVSSGSLPFTGLEAGLVALAGLALLAGGFAMRRVARPVA